MRRKYIGDKKSIEARSEDGGRVWKGVMFDAGRETKFDDASLAELEELARKHSMRPAQPGKA